MNERHYECPNCGEGYYLSWRDEEEGRTLCPECWCEIEPVIGVPLSEHPNLQRPWATGWWQEGFVL